MPRTSDQSTVPVAKALGSQGFFSALQAYYGLLKDAGGVVEKANASTAARAGATPSVWETQKQKAVAGALDEHQRKCEGNEVHRALQADEAYQRAWRELNDRELRKVADSNGKRLWWFTVHQTLATGLMTLCLSREMHARGMLFLTKRTLKRAEVLATELVDLLTVAHGLDKLPGAGLDREWWPRLSSDLDLTIDALRRVQAQPGRLPKATIKAAEHEALDAWCIVATCIYSRDFDEHASRARSIVQALCEMAGMKLHRTTIANAVHRHLKATRPKPRRRRP
jgi:hypothetical protein